MGLLLLTPACGLFSTQGSDTTQSQEVVAETATVTSSATSKQISNQSQGASVEGSVESVTTENHQGISTWMFIVGALIFGLIMPQPRFIKLLF